MSRVQSSPRPADGGAGMSWRRCLLHFFHFHSGIMLVQSCLLLIAFLGIQRGLCLKCYTCLSNEPRDACAKFDKSKVPLKTCDRKELERTEAMAKEMHPKIGKLFEVDAAVEPLLPLNCLKQESKYGNKHYVLRGCQLATSNDLDICVKVKKDNTEHFQTNYCSLCNGDGCNGAPTKSTSHIIFVFVVTFLIYF
ncbi:uncharacterized protein LOC123003587 [Tribolium madens]|uniref:uncharacterized protein LOC123003587 n=1 Tax=Tribolium madens TaxID=41895 RepID=UPI001CF74BFE|nr:uncharacterized protein LOC123003587 [Tribolium madens]